MRETVVQLLNPAKGETYLDLTAGYGGHAQTIMQKTGAAATLVDRDENAIKHIRDLGLDNVTLLHQDFAQAAEQLVKDQQTFDLILVDLGVSSPQFDQAERGFSFRSNANLDMRMDGRQTKTAAKLVNELSQSDLTEIIRNFGEEKPHHARAIAQAIVDNRPINSTNELADIIKQTIRGRGKIHPATRTFQALRIAVNDELGQIEKLLPSLPDLLNPGGRVAIISFHSLEDRLVKQYFKSQADLGLEAELEPLLKRPLTGSTTDVHNPRARSAKLRGAVKIKNRKDYTR
jgi:16S rRNA (cytosine1402-N4)-methyltransferase